MYYYKSPKGYYYKQYKNGKKKRIPNKKYKQIKHIGGTINSSFLEDVILNIDFNINSKHNKYKNMVGPLNGNKLEDFNLPSDNTYFYKFNLSKFKRKKILISEPLALFVLKLLDNFLNINIVVPKIIRLVFKKGVFIGYITSNVHESADISFEGEHFDNNIKYNPQKESEEKDYIIFYFMIRILLGSIDIEDNYFLVKNTKEKKHYFLTWNTDIRNFNIKEEIEEYEFPNNGDIILKNAVSIFKKNLDEIKSILLSKLPMLETDINMLIESIRKNIEDVKKYKSFTSLSCSLSPVFAKI
tara:strand:- start:133 stop:1029 length:897 start_codon:yes stop_codon:yes gene_type:complete